MCGILCAYFLIQKKIDYVLIEGARICSGITKNTTAKITSQHGLIYDKLIKKSGIELARMYLQANELAVKKFQEICTTINCDFEQRSMIKPQLFINGLEAVTNLLTPSTKRCNNNGNSGKRWI